MTPLLHRQVLAAMGTHAIAWCLADPDTGIPHLRSSCWGSTCLSRRLPVPWPERAGFSCLPAGIVVGPSAGLAPEPFCTVTWRQVRAACDDISAADRADLARIRAEGQRIATARYALRMPWKPTPAQRAEHAQSLAPLLTAARIQSTEQGLAIVGALRVLERPEPTDLLELLAMSGAS